LHSENLSQKPKAINKRALGASKNILVSGPTDRTVRISDLNTGRCIHVFGGHTSTVRGLVIVIREPQS
jgi:WD40 repeat protein